MAQLPLVQQKDSALNTLIQKWKSILDPVIASTGGSAGAIIGEVKSAFLTEDQFQAQAGAAWVLCDGRNVKGSAYEQITKQSNIPDMRSTSPRCKDNGKGLGPELALGSYQPDHFASHSHGGTTGNDSPDHAHVPPTGPHFVTASPGSGGVFSSTVPAGSDVNAVNGNGSTGGATVRHQHSVAADGSGTETLGKSTTLNFFVRIN